MTYPLFPHGSTIRLPPLNTILKSLGIGLLFALLLSGCTRYPSSFEGSGWHASFPALPKVETIFEGKIIRKQRAQVEYQGRLYRASYTIWKRHPKTKETDQRWINRVKRCMSITVLDIHTENMSSYTLTHLIAKENSKENTSNYYWLDSYFDGHCRYVLIYRQPHSKIEARGLEFLKSAEWKPEETIHNTQYTIK